MDKIGGDNAVHMYCSKTEKKSMQIKKGTAANLRHSVAADSSGVSRHNRHIAAFELDGETIELRSMDNLVIENGDRIVVAGTVEDDLFKAVAYKNLTNGAVGRPPSSLLIFAGLLCFVLGFLTIWVFGLGVLFLIGGVVCLYYARRLGQSYRMIKKQT